MTVQSQVDQGGSRRVFDWRDIAARRLAADWLAAGVVASLPWSTSATAILICGWLAVFLTTTTRNELRDVLSIPAGRLPVLLWIAGFIGMAWAVEATWAERAEALGSFHRLLILPLVLIQFRRSERPLLIAYAFLASTTLLLLVSYVLAFWPGLAWRGKVTGVPVKDYIAQSGFFVFSACACLLSGGAMWAQQRRGVALGLLGLAALFVISVLFVATARTTLIVLAVMLLVVCARQLGRRGMFMGVLLLGIAGTAAWHSSDYLRDRVEAVGAEIERYANDSEVASAGLRLEFWRKAARFWAEAPLVGHGTGSIPELYRRSAAGQDGYRGAEATNPHNQLLAVAVQLGALGALLLGAMWLAHARLFTAPGALTTLGLALVLQHLTSCLFNSHLFDFTLGWAYVWGIGVLGGMAWRTQREGRATASPNTRKPCAAAITGP